MARKLAINLNQRSITEPRRGNFRFRGQQKKEKFKSENSIIDKNNIKNGSHEITNQTDVNSIEKKDEKITSKEKKDPTILNAPEEDREGSVRHEVTETAQLHDRGRKRIREDESTVNEKDEVEEDEMMKLIGFADFATTKNKKVPGTDCYGTQVVQKTEYRQYMNREKGFNRPLSPTRIDRKKKRAKGAKD